jgi:hypothetical protein
MGKFDRDRVVFYSKQDMSSGHFLSKAESILRQDFKGNPSDINDVLELYNIKLYIDNELYLNSWSQSDIEIFKESVKEYGQLIGELISKINDGNVLIHHEGLMFEYEESFWLLIDNYSVFKNISAFMIGEILTKKPRQIKIILKHKGVVNRYSDVLRAFLISYHRSAEILLSVFEVEKGFGEVKLFIPKCLTAKEKEKIVSGYIDSEICNINYLPIIQNSQKTNNFLITDKTRLKAKKKYQEEVNKFFGDKSNGSFMKCVTSISYPENATEIKGCVVEDGVIHYVYSLAFIKDNKHPYLLFLNFKLLFEYLDRQNRIDLVSKASKVGAVERMVGLRSNNEYFNGMSFKNSEMTSQAQIFTYSSILTSLDTSLEEVLGIVYASFFAEQYGYAKNASLTMPTASSSALEKVRMLAPELESVLKQYKLFVEEHQIDFELLQMSSGSTSIKGIPSLNENKYIYINSDNKKALICSELFFSDQAMLAYVKPFKEKDYQNLFELLWNESGVEFDSYEEYQVANINYLIEEGYLFIDDAGCVKITNKNRVLILKDLKENEVASFHHYSSAEKDEVIVMFKEKLIFFDSSLLSKPEQDYFNFHLNKSEFTNGLDLRNSYLHGTQANSSEVSQHEKSYLIYLKLLTLVILKIDDDLFIDSMLKSKGEYSPPPIKQTSKPN